MKARRKAVEFSYTQRGPVERQMPCKGIVLGHEVEVQGRRLLVREISSGYHALKRK